MQVKLKANNKIKLPKEIHEYLGNAQEIYLCIEFGSWARYLSRLPPDYYENRSDSIVQKIKVLAHENIRLPLDTIMYLEIETGNAIELISQPYMFKESDKLDYKIYLKEPQRGW